MSDIEIEISPFLSDTFYLSYSDSFRYGLTEGIIYTPRLIDRDSGVNLENSPRFYKRLAYDLVHEHLHKLLWELEDKETSLNLDHIDKSQDNQSYVISNLGECK